MNLTKVGNSSFKLFNQFFRTYEVRKNWLGNKMFKRFNLILKMLFLFLVVSGGVLFFGLGKVKAADADVVINEIYSNAETGKVEWIELYNISGQDMILNGFTIEDGTAKPESLNTMFIKNGGYKTLSKGVDFSFGLNDLGDLVILKYNGVETDCVAYGNWSDGNLSDNAPVPSKGQSIMRIHDGYDTDIDKNDFIVQIIPIPGVGFPDPKIIEDIEIGSDFVNLAWSKAEEVDFLKYEIYQSESVDELGAKLGEINNINNYYEINNLLSGKTYYYIVGKCNTSDICSYSNQASTTLPIIYSDDIIVNELVADPSGDEELEWIELYNDSDYPVNLIGWKLEDTLGSVHSHIINIIDDPVTTIGSRQYLLFYRKNTGITLNNDGDGARLYQPNNTIALSETQIFTDGEKGWSFARGSTGNWSWTTKITPGAVNEIILPLNDEENISDANQPVNSEPIEISTGDYQNYLDKLVKIRGKVISTSGNTFYLDDGSGVVKVYIQEKTGIEKPEMHRNDIFEIIGVVDLYGQTWRILPRILDDIILIETAPVATKVTATKKVVAKVVTAAKSPLISKAVAAATNSPSDENTDKNDTLNQIVKPH